MNDPRPTIDLRAPAREQIQRGEGLEHPDRIIRTEHGDRAGQADALTALRGGRQDNRRRRDDEVGAEVLADPEDIEADLIGQLDLFHEIADRPPAGRRGHAAKSTAPAPGCGGRCASGEPR